MIWSRWWLPPTRLTTDEAGKVEFTGFLGDYELTWQGKKTTFTLDQKGTTALTLKL